MNGKMRRQWSISSKLWLAITILILIVLGGLGLTITRLFEDFYLKQKLHSLETEAKEIAAQLVEVPSLSSRLKLLDALKLTSGTQLVVLDTNGNIVVYSEDKNSAGAGSSAILGGALGGNWPTRPLRPVDFFTEDSLAKVLNGQTISIQALPIAGGGQTMLLAATPVGTKPIQGIVLLGSSAEPVQESIAAFRRLILYVSLAAVVLAAIVSLVFSRQVTRPLALMQRGATRMAKGDFLPIQGVTSKDELGALAESLNAMGESLKNHMDWLSQEKNMLQGIVESISDAVIMLSSEGTVLYANDSAKAFWQENETELLERREQIILFLQSIMDEGQAEKVVQLTLGTQVLQVVMAPLAEVEGLHGHVAVLRDITASLRAEKERRDFLASVTHELRTPLHLIQGYLEAIQDDVIPRHQQGEYVDLVLDEAGRLGRLVNELQDVNRLERGQSMKLVPLDLAVFMSELEQRFQGRAQELGVNLEIPSAEGEELFADPDRLLQVFINLLDNALRHTPPGKTVRVMVEGDSRQVRMAVQDEGEGIPKEALPLIFERFFRVDKARARKDGGMGLGLAIVRQIAEAHGGTIKVESDMGEGTTFWLTLPRKQAPDQ